MTYYRVALWVDQSSTWQWESRVITSLDVVGRFLRLYRSMPWGHIRVFFSPSVEDLDEMLARANQGLASLSLTAEQFLDESKPLPSPEMNQFESECGPSTSLGTVVTSLLREQACHKQSMNAHFKESMNHLDKRRIEAELGTSGDHDTPYTFSLSASIPELLSWIGLLARVHRGELEP